MAQFHQLPSRKDPKDSAWEASNVEAEERTKAAPTAAIPSLSHLSFHDFDEVYEPAEDTYLFLDALLHEMDNESFAEGRNQDEGPFIVLEIGCGSGVVSVFVRNQWKTRSGDWELQSFVTDVNRRALEVALETDRANNGVNSNQRRSETDESTDSANPKSSSASTGTINPPLFLHSMEAILCDLATPLLSRLQGQIDVLLFNPPYVPTEDDEVGIHDISAAWAGGVKGRRVVDRAIPQMAQLLRPKSGKAFVVTVDDNRPSEMAHILWENHQLVMKPLFRRRSRNEYLTIQKITFEQHDNDQTGDE